MAVTSLTIQQISEAGLVANYSAANVDGSTFSNAPAGRIFLHVKNTDVAARTITVAAIKTSETVPGMGVMTKAGVSVAVASGTDRMIGPFPPDAFGILPTVTFSAITGVTIAALIL